MIEDYRVNLDVYNGPLDLLLYLIRREELDIYDIHIARITEQYLQYVDVLQQLDPNLAGEFLVLAATLIEIKTRMLLPSPPPAEEGSDEGLDIDPRTELVRQLLEYKAFKDAAVDLRAAADAQAARHPRKPFVDLPDEEVDIEDAQVWDLVDAFTRMLDSIGQLKTHHEVIYDDTPVELHAVDLLDRLGRQGPITFRQVFEQATSRSEIVGLFLALLELVRQRKVRAHQQDNFSEILIALPAEGHQDGTYVADEPQAADGNDDHGTTVLASGQAPAEGLLDTDDEPDDDDSDEDDEESEYLSDQPDDETDDDDPAQEDDEEDDFDDEDDDDEEDDEEDDDDED